MTKNTRFSPEVRQRAVRMVLESQGEYDSQWATICSIAPKIGCTPETLRVWVRQHERDTGGGDGGLTTAERQRLKELERENRELRRSNDILRQASAYFAKAEFDRLWKKLMPLLDKLREQYGVGPLCSELHIAPSTYYHCQQQRHHPDKRSARAQRDDWLKKEIQRVYDENHKVYGVRKVWRQLLREGIRVARCTVARLMAVMGLAGVLRGKKVRTTISRKAVAAGDRVNRQFVAERPDQLWVADFTYVSTWQGFVYVAFIIDVFAGYIVGWRVSSSMETTFVLDALEQALWARRPSGTVHHSDKGSQYVSLAYTQRLKEAGLLASTGSTGDSYDNAMAESINGLYKAEVIHRKSWKNRAEVELATLTWVDWYNNRRLLERLGHTPPAEAEKAYYASIGNDDLAA
ncbi:IS3-like element IS629 family transposase [Escherichia coli]|uniref:IS3-like element IS629 family transposase n=15 Tax=Enterobacteriaceae TaxID=543 RepID=A0A626FBH0_SALTM|nr:IS3-like element IS629 family transposase [Escherichia coli O145 str. RM9872]AZH46718.1 IS3 family transposase [Escherichia coli]EBB0380159.1 IS3-like element IS629 family transposase [Salmonella enterica]EBW3042440.1 IS3-like element IS629 family transposase [Salmonella enterica subsp. enterica serovar Virchow]ECD6247408.1 IS3-like element IS629 family transposase [Salmonella enterica subsp. enterica serovar Montevideo]ECN8524698.1 IS3-like element IS629 family transposase [Salmonella ente